MAFTPSQWKLIENFRGEFGDGDAGNVDADKYVDWFLIFAKEFYRILKDDGSVVIDIGGAWNKGELTRSLYQFELLIELSKQFHLAQECYWYNPAKLPSPAEWVTVRRIRVKDAVELIMWLSKSQFPKADNRKVLLPYSKDMIRLIENGYSAKTRPSGHNIRQCARLDRIINCFVKTNTFLGYRR